MLLCGQTNSSDGFCMFTVFRSNKLVSLFYAAVILLCSHCKKIGAQTLLIGAIIVTEVLITFKFDWHTFTKPLPGYVVVGWVIGLVSLAIWTIWHFYLQRLLQHTEVRSSAAVSHNAAAAAEVSDNELNGGVRRRKARAPTAH